MSLTITSIRLASDSEWDSCWHDCDHATWFQSREWTELWCALAEIKSRPQPRAIRFSDGKTAVVPMLAATAHKGLVKTHCMSPGGGYGGWLSTDALEIGHATCLSRSLLDLGNVEWLTNPFDPLVLASGMLSGRMQYTDAVALHEGMDSVVRRWTKGHRSAVQKAARAGVAVRRAESIDDWRSYHALYRHSVRRWGESATSNHPLKLFEALYNLNSSNVVLWLATVEHEVVAGAVCLYAGRQVSYWHGAALDSHFHVRPVNLLLHAAIADACSCGKHWFDLGLSGGHEGVRAFKKSFGAVPLPAIHVVATTRGSRWVGAMVGLKDRVVARVVSGK